MQRLYAAVVELVDTQDSKFCVHYGRAGSIPARGTRKVYRVFIFSTDRAVLCRSYLYLLENREVLSLFYGGNK